jgi:protein-tyrosine kinase
VNMLLTSIGTANRRAPRIDSRLVGLINPSSPESEQYRKLRYLVELRKKPSQGLVIGITSPLAGDGKSTTAINLAGVLAQNQNNRVLLVDTDLRRRSDYLRRALDLEGAPISGLTELVGKPKAEWSSYSRRLNPFNISIMFCGSNLSDPYETFISPEFGALVAKMRSKYDYIVMDTPPIVPVSESRLICRLLDGVFMVVSAHQTPREMLGEALDTIEPGNVIGLVFNNADRTASYYYDY